MISGALRASAADYYVRPSGDDAAPGTSPEAAWRTPERVNGSRLLPGDRVRFEAGASFHGNLSLTAEDAGTSHAPVVIGSFGIGRATLLAGDQTGITIE
ncbi:MAG: right-handed parallel beta-helix repeat-containing protein, partial [Verrucomicrobiales bacterium]|nr:right-handed parallel beta-helix repeat-containing protein [Verrucomicrobiales bacterium]